MSEDDFHLKALEVATQAAKDSGVGRISARVEEIESLLKQLVEAKRSHNGTKNISGQSPGISGIGN